jgi:cysteine desulfurase
MDLNNFIYLDNNATTLMPESVKNEIVKWMNKGNPSALYAKDIGTENLIKKFKEKVAQVSEFDPNEYDVIITSGATESNNFILRAVCNSYINIKHRQPHFIISSMEHKSLLECAKDLKKNKKIELSIVEPYNAPFQGDATKQMIGRITWDTIKPHMQPNTTLVCVMHANNETGIINDIDTIGKHLARSEYGIPFYVDCVQTFGKFPVKPTSRYITAFTASLHKLSGPPGIGVFVVLKSFMQGYKLCAEICGSQNNGMRGGTENIPYIGGSIMAMRETFHNRDLKNRNNMALQLYVLNALIDKIPTSFFEKWTEENRVLITGLPTYKNNQPPRLEMVVIGTVEMDPVNRSRYMLPNTLMVSFIKHDVTGHMPSKIEEFTEGGGDSSINSLPVCNFKLANKLLTSGVIVGLGSACNTGQTSYVLETMKVPKVVANGAIRISFGDHNTDNDARVFVRETLLALRELL